GAYPPAALAPVAVAALAGAFVADQAGIDAYLLPAASTIDVRAADYAIYGLLGCCCAMVGILVMRLIASIEGTVKRSPLPLWGRPVLGGLLLIPLAMASPQVLSSGHGALHLDLTTHLPLIWIGALLTLKCLASGISLGFGFRGGLFFASLFMGTLVGALFAGLLAMATGVPVIDATSAALAGMAALAAAVVGAPMTMAMLVLEGTHDFLLTSVVMSAVLVSSTLVRQWFGYSFSTWRMHLRGETIKSARDVGWVQNLNAGRMMRKGVATAPADLDTASFRQRFPLGSGSRVILVDSEGHYAGIVQIPRMYGDGVKPDAVVGDYAENRDVALAANANVVAVMQRFDQTQADELAVVASDGQVLGVVSEAFVRKRYAEELDKRQRELMGERVEDSD
ncbi:chloride channel protein, partial [Stenotrophomonas sp.]|uniref:chloride channel protein n=1 Tax=Stenotrophomonas sp. TaxID=69392 RepID=UPI0028A8C6AF